MTKPFILSLVFLAFSVIARNAWAVQATVYFTPASASPKVGESFNVDIGVNTSGESVTALKVYLTFDKDKLTITGFDRSASVFTNWWEANYDNDAGWIHLQATNPSPGYMGEGLLTRINFQAKAEGTAQINTASDSLILKADDTNLFSSSSPGSASYTVLPVTDDQGDDNGSDDDNDDDDSDGADDGDQGDEDNRKTGDVNGDGVIEITDLSLLLSQWGGSGTADSNRDGVVDITDLSMLLSNWGL